MRNNSITPFLINRIKEAKAMFTKLILNIKTLLRNIKRRDILYFPLLFLFSHQTFAACSLPMPANAKISAWTSCNATLKWDAVSGAEYYKVKYKFKNVIGWTTISAQITATSYTFTDLVADSNYKFAVAAFCANGDNSGYKVQSRKLRAVTIPKSLTASNRAGSSVSLSWIAYCPTSSYNIGFRITSAQAWTIIGNIVTTEQVVTGLSPNTSYDFRVQGQNGQDTSGWSPYVTMNSGSGTSAPKPNILLFVLDDGRYDQFQPNGGPSWFNTPSINRIANEGINFTYTFPTTSQCGPSRVSIYSGLYAHHHGAIDNNTRHYDGIPLVQQILHDAGYYTGFVGKYGQLQGNPQGFDWWATTDINGYTDPPYEVNGRDTFISGHISDVYQSLAMTFLNNVPEGKKFCLMFFTRVPHSPTTPRTEDLNLFATETMPFPDNFYRYSVNYPSYLYNNSGHSWTYSKAETESIKLQDFQCLYGAEMNMTAFLKWLTAKGILDSTIIIFTSDNGYMEGEHKLKAKQIALEESIRLPLFIRYPAWFTPGQINTSIMANNIDIAPTLLDVAGIPDTVQMDGISLRQLYNGTVHRKYFYYQFAGENASAPLHAIRSSQYKYIKTNCTQLTEEFYDLSTDPQENTNQINNSSYTSLIAAYRNVTDSIKTALGDSDQAPIDCYLSNVQFSREEDENEDEFNLRILDVYPNPASQYFIIHFNDEQREDMDVWVTNVLNETVYYKKLPNTNSISTMINASGWQKGLYLATVKKGSKTFSTKLSIQ